MTNRPEYLSALFGTALAGGVSVALSTFSTPSELERLVAASGISTLLFEDAVLKTDFAAMLLQLEPGIAEAALGQLSRRNFPFLRHLVRLAGLTGSADIARPADEAFGSCEAWDTFIARGASVPEQVVAARAAKVCPADTGGLFFPRAPPACPKAYFMHNRLSPSSGGAGHA